jgi:hypothetical protein
MKDWNTKKYGTTEPTKAGKVAARPDLERAQSTVDKTNVKAKGGAGALPTHGAMSHKDAGGNLIINEQKPGSGSRATIYKAGSKTAEGPMGEGSTVRSSSSDPNTEYGKYKKDMEGTGKVTHGGISAPNIGAKENKNLNTGMGYSETSGKSGRKRKIYNKEGEKVAVTKRKKQGGAKVRLTRAGRKDEDTTLTKTKKSGVQKVKGAPKVKKEKRTAAERKSDRITKRSDKSFDKFVKKQKKQGNWDYNTDTIKNT